MKEWLTDLLSRWFIPREDYDQVQERQRRAIQDEQMAEERTKHAVRELYEVMDKAYGNYRPLESFADAADIKEFRHEDVQLDGVTWGWQVRLPNLRFYTMRDPKQELRRIKEYAAEQLTQKFRQHIQEKLFAI